MLPTVESFDTEATACVPVVAEPKCDKVSTYIENPSHKYLNVAKSSTFMWIHQQLKHDRVNTLKVQILTNVTT